MARTVSLVVLVAILILMAGLFFQIMATFLLPLFVALVLVIMFHPVYRWAVRRLRGHCRIAAAVTTAAILLAFLGPLLSLGFRAVSEAVRMTQQGGMELNSVHALAQAAARVGEHFGVEIPAETVEQQMRSGINEWLAPVALTTTQTILKVLVGLVVIVVAVYYFFADGPLMVRTAMQLSPLDDRYKQQLVDEFERVCRAVVVSMLVTAVVQGVLAGAAYWLLGMRVVFVLTILTMIGSLIPFVGAAAVWICVCLWLFFHDDRPLAAASLAVYGAVIISGVDNLIKPMVLHGRTNIHPLLALLSVLGGVQVLGPIGLFVGPMAVAFLYALLNMLRGELRDASIRGVAASTAPTSPPATGPT